MNIHTIGLITYHYPHLKTEQVLQRLLGSERKVVFRIYALPFTNRKPRKTLIQHRPNQVAAVHPQHIAEKHKIPYQICEADTDIDSGCDVYLVLGAGILSPECVNDKKIINAHPGIIPASRGLDSFKWAIYDHKPLGNTLHYIDARVDAGDVISVVPTHVYSSDTIATLARRHYENEIDLLSRFNDYLHHPQNSYPDIAEGEAKRRMPLEMEKELKKQFSAYKEIFGGS